MFDDQMRMAFLLSSFFLSLLNRFQYMLFLSLVISFFDYFFFAEHMLNYGI